MTRPRWFKRVAWLAAFTVGSLGAAAAVAAPAQAVTPNSYTAQFTLTKNWMDPTNSTLVLKLIGFYNGDPVVGGTSTYWWRAGSGTGSTDDCYSDHGWLPNGTYSVTLYEGYNGSKIKGIVFHISNKLCSKGTTTRTDLFIHSEMTQSGGQSGCISGGDGPQCWEGLNDYKSNGCIKLKPSDIAEADADWKRAYAVGQTVSGGLVVTG